MSQIPNISQEVGEDALVWMSREAVNLFPQLRPLCFPKEFKVPKGYYSPEVFISSAFTGAQYISSSLFPSEDVSSVSLHLVSSRLIQFQVPTYLVSSDLCDALLHTDPPDDMLLSEIQWPFPAMLFMLPADFSMRYVGAVVPHIAVAHVPARWICRTPIKFGNAPVREIEVNQSGDIAVIVSTVIENGSPVHYDSRAVIAGTTVKSLFPESLTYYQFAALKCGDPENRARDLNISHNLSSLAINLMLAMMAEPELITKERVLSPAKKDTKTNKIKRRALWRPNFIGENFRIVYERNDPIGSHASPHAHWRQGHYRNHRHGPELCLVKRIFIKPVFVGLSTSPAAGANPI